MDSPTSLLRKFEQDKAKNPRAYNAAVYKEIRNSQHSDRQLMNRTHYIPQAKFKEAFFSKQPSQEKILSKDGDVASKTESEGPFQFKNKLPPDFKVE